MVDMVSQVGLNQTQTANYNYTPMTQINAGELTNCLLSRDKNVKQNENGNYYTTTNAGKKIGTIAGVIASLAGKVIGTGSLKSLLNLKSVLVTCPALALTGFGLGALVDHIVNTKRSQKADENVTQKNMTNVCYKA